MLPLGTEADGESSRRSNVIILDLGICYASIYFEINYLDSVIAFWLCFIFHNKREIKGKFASTSFNKATGNKLPGFLFSRLLYYSYAFVFMIYYYNVHLFILVAHDEPLDTLTEYQISVFTHRQTVQQAAVFFPLDTVNLITDHVSSFGFGAGSLRHLQSFRMQLQAFL